MNKTRTAILVAVLVGLGALVAIKFAVRANPSIPEAVPLTGGQPLSVTVSDRGTEAETSKSEDPRIAGDAAGPGEPQPDQAAERVAMGAGSATTGPLPKMLELGSVGCVACQEMEPIVADLRLELKGKVDIEFIDVLKNPAVAEEHRVMTIPTQVFLDADGNELFRHIGVFPKDEILAKMAEVRMTE